jgi:hypothetical protein
MADDTYDSGHVVIPVLNPSGDIHNIAVPEDTSMADLHDSLVDSGYAHPALDQQLGQQQPTKDGAIEYSPAFKKLAANMWDRSGRGVQQTEVGTYIDKSGNAGNVTEHPTGSDPNANVKVNVPNDAVGVIHTHPNHSGDRPSPADVQAAKDNKKTVYVTSRTGLWATDPSGKITQIFSNPLWMRDKNPK